MSGAQTAVLGVLRQCAESRTNSDASAVAIADAHNQMLVDHGEPGVQALFISMVTLTTELVRAFGKQLDKSEAAVLDLITLGWRSDQS